MSDDGLRIDKWLWYARFFKSRSLASKVCLAGAVRVDGMSVKKAHVKLKVGDTLTFPQGQHIRVVRVAALGSRRGPASEAATLYEDLKPPEPENRLPKQARLTSAAIRAQGAGARPRRSGAPSIDCGPPLPRKPRPDTQCDGRAKIRERLLAGISIARSS